MSTMLCSRLPRTDVIPIMVFVFIFVEGLGPAYFSRALHG